MTLTHMSLFTGIGGIDLAAEWAGFETIGQVEIDAYAIKVLEKHWPDVALFGDVRGVTGETINELVAHANRRGSQERRPQDRSSGDRCGTGREAPEDFGTETPESSFVADAEGQPIGSRLCEGEQGGERRGRSGDGDGQRLTVLSGGFPCQPFSTAGKRQGTLDSRNLWPEFRRLIGEARPRWVVAENVPGLFTIDAGRVFGEVVNDLAEMGYSVGWCSYGAVDVGALHRRNRVFIVGYAASRDGTLPSLLVRQGEGKSGGTGRGSRTLANAQSRQDNGRVRGDLDNKAGQRGRVNSTADAGGQDVPNNQGIGRGAWGGESEGKPRGRDTEFNSWWLVEPDVGRVANGVPKRVDRLKCLGNAVVPQQIYEVFRGIAEHELTYLDRSPII